MLLEIGPHLMEALKFGSGACVALMFLWAMRHTL